MKTHWPSLAAVAAALVLAGCSTVDSRVKRNTDFTTWSPEVQEKVRAGQIAVGFSMEQVETALGKADYFSSRTTGDGTAQVWGYRDRGPRFSLGFGFGSMNGASGFGMGAGASTGGYGWEDDEKIRVIFDRAGQVVAIEQAQR